MTTVKPISESSVLQWPNGGYIEVRTVLSMPHSLEQRRIRSCRRITPEMERPMLLSGDPEPASGLWFVLKTERTSLLRSEQMAIFPRLRITTQMEKPMSLYFA